MYIHVYILYIYIFIYAPTKTPLAQVRDLLEVRLLYSSMLIQ